MPDRHDDRTPRRTAHRRLGTAALGAAAALCAALPAVPAAAAAKPVAVTVSFDAGASVRLDGRRFAGERVARLNAILAAHPRVRAERLFDASAASLDRRRARVQGKGRRAVPDLNRHFRLVAPDAEERDAVLAALQPLGVVDAALAEPRPAPAPATPSFAARQRYGTSAPAGIDVAAFAGLPGGRGEHVRIVDVEYAWNTAHEELGKAATVGALVANGTPKDPFPEQNGDHGTAVLGELIAADDGAGVTGLAPDSEIGLVNAATAGACPVACWTVADAVTVAHRSMQPGDVMLLEQQFPARESRTAYGPIELWEPVYDAIRLATQDGIIVVEAAGNGGVNLDAPQYGARFPDGKADSGAIVVGAGSGDCTAPANGRLSHSNYGSRVDLQGWGQCVTTTGYGGLFDGGSLNSRYTDSFAGTSSAAPIVAAAAALYSSVYEAAHGVAPSPQLVRSRLIATGTPQANEAGGHIGPLPNLRAAAADFVAPSGEPQAPAPPVAADRSFEEGTAGWTASGGTLERVAAADAPDGGWVARATWTAGESYGVEDDAAPAVASTTAGATYAAGCSVRAANAQSAGRPVRIVVRERAAGTGELVRETAAASTLGTGFARLSVAAVAAATGNTLGVRCEQTAAVAGDAFELDQVTLAEAGESDGVTRAGSVWTAASVNVKRVSPLALGAPRDVVALRAYVDGRGTTTGTQPVSGVLYAASGSGPGARIATTQPLTVSAGRAAGWVTLSFARPVRLPAGTYWIGLHAGGNRAVLRYAAEAAPAALRYNGDAYGDGATAAFGTATTDAKALSVYALGARAG